MERFRIGEWDVDATLDELRRGDAVVRLEPRLTRLLVYLAERPGRVVSPGELLDNVWTGVVVTPASVYTSIAQLRRLLGDDGADNRYIVTLPRRGYRLVASVVPRAAGDSDGGAPDGEPAAAGADGAAPPVTDDDDAGPSSSAESAPVAPTNPDVGGTPTEGAHAADATATATVTRGRRTRIALGVAAAAAVVALVTALVVTSGTRDTVPRDAGPVREVDAIAVLPFESRPGNPRDAEYAALLTESLRESLIRAPRLRVIASASSAQANEFDLPATVARLGLTHVLRGRVTRTDTVVRADVSLVDARTRATIWSGMRERPVDRRADLSGDVVDLVAQRLLPPTAAEAVPRGEAFEVYAAARRQERLRTPESLARAVSLYERAIALDPELAVAWVGRASTVISRYFLDGVPLREAAALAEPALTRALALEPELAEAYAVRGLLRAEQWRLKEAADDLRHATRLNPNLADAHVRLAMVFEYQGLPRDALGALDVASRVDPFNYILHVRRCLALQNLGRFDDARAACTTAESLGPDAPNAIWASALIAMSEGRLDRAIAEYRRAIELAPRRTDLLTQLGWLYLDAGSIREADATMGAARLVATDGAVTALEAARPAVASADWTRVLAQLDAAAPRIAASAEASVDAALLALTAGDARRAAAFADAAKRAPDWDEDRLYGVWLARWGRSPALTLALVARSRGDAATEQRFLANVAEFVGDLERAGQQWAGLDYLSACVHALHGRREEALARLDAASARGWRRAWWARQDPALTSLRGDPRFDRWLETLEESNRRARLAAR